MKRFTLSSGLLSLVMPLAAATMLLSACGSSAAPIAPPSSFPTAQNLPALQIKSRVVNLSDSGGTGYKYAKLSLDVLFADPKGTFLKASGTGLTQLQTTFNTDNQNLVTAFDDVITNDVSTMTSKQLSTTAGKQALRQELMRDFNARIAKGPAVVYVSFADFVMQ